MTRLPCLGSDDILYRLRKEQIEREKNIAMTRASAYGSINRDDEWIQRLVRDAGDEIERLRALVDAKPA